MCRRRCGGLMPRPNGSRDRTWDRRADVFGLAALVHEMLWARRVAALGDEAAASLTEIAGGDLSRLRAVFGRALAKEPGTRFDTALDFAGALQEAFSVSTARVGPRPDLNQTLSPKADTMREEAPAESEPRLPLDAETLAVSEPAAAFDRIEEEPSEPILVRGHFNLDVLNVRGYAELDRAPAAVPAVPPVLALPRMAVMDDRPVAPDGALEPPRPRSSIAPLAFALVIGAALGFAAGFGVGTRGRSEGPDNTSTAAATASDSNSEAAATSGSAREFTEGTVPAAQSTAAPLPAAPPRTAAPRPATTQNPAVAAPIAGSVLVRSTPPGARVFVDGREYGRTPVTIGSLARGGHTVRVMGDGFVTDERQVTITSAQRTHSITVRLSPERLPVAAGRGQAPLPAAGEERGAGQLTVESRPAGAQVFIDGQLVGITPLSLAEVPAGDHTLHLDHADYRRWSAAIRIVASKPHRVAASLDR